MNCNQISFTGEFYPEIKNNYKQIFSAQTAYQITSLLEGVVKRGTGKKFLNGMVLAIEPMINLGTHRIKQLKDGWTILTADGKVSAHFEHNVALLDGKPELLSSFKYIYSSLGIKSDEEEGLRKTPLVI